MNIRIVRDMLVIVLLAFGIYSYYSSLYEKNREAISCPISTVSVHINERGELVLVSADNVSISTDDIGFTINYIYNNSEDFTNIRTPNVTNIKR